MVCHTMTHENHKGKNALTTFYLTAHMVMCLFSCEATAIKTGTNMKRQEI